MASRATLIWSANGGVQRDGRIRHQENLRRRVQAQAAFARQADQVRSQHLGQVRLVRAQHFGIGGVQVNGVTIGRDRHPIDARTGVIFHRVGHPQRDLARLQTPREQAREAPLHQRLNTFLEA